MRSIKILNLAMLRIAIRISDQGMTQIKWKRKLKNDNRSKIVFKYYVKDKKCINTVVVTMIE